ncbi:MAG: sugar transferase [Christensenellales bacterium]|jgi:undecaprenyl phosphate N,N'-diacetylbacillosamine 1-phosphate transferase
MYRKFFKRVIDILLSLIALIILSPILLIVAIVVKTKLGSPVLYTTKRPGKNGEIFNLHKFRSMTNERDENGKLLPDNKRLTKLGRVLRKTSIDELPELWDVLIGKMSLIGPRPLSPKYLPYFTEYENQRHDVRPGITGLAQINGRSGLNWEERFEYDVQYVNNLTFINDIKIFCQTIYKVLKRADTLEREEISLLNFDDYRKIQLENKNKYKEIGSEFWLENKEIGDSYLNKFSNAQYVFSGRTAIDCIIKDITQKGIENIYLPSFLCQSMVAPIKKHSTNISFYNISVDNQRFVADLSSMNVVDNSALCICDYFFFDNDYYKKLLSFAKNNKMIVIHDITHSLLSDDLTVEEDDYYFASLRKWLPVPDGAILGKRGEKININDTYLYKEFTDIKIQAMKNKKNYILNNKGNKDDFRELYRNAEELLERGYTNKAISKDSLDIIRHTNFNKVIDTRKDNAKIIAEGLKELEQVKTIYQEDSCPLFVPVLFADKEQRDNLKKHMIEKNIYLPIHWERSIDVKSLEQIQDIYDKILSIVIDQRYSAADMRKILTETKQYFRVK